MKVARIASVGSLASLTFAAWAQTVSYSSFLPGYGFDTVAQGIAILGPTNLNPVIGGFRFTAGVTGVLADITLPIQYVVGNSTIVALQLCDANGVGEIGSVRATWSIPSAAAMHLVTVTNGNPSLTLDAGSDYWLVMSTGGDAVHFWGRSALGGLMFNGYEFHNDGVFHYGNTDVFPAYEVRVVPEPATMVSLSLGALALMRRRTRHSKNN